MNYDSWRISFQSAESAAKSAYNQAEEIGTQLNKLKELLATKDKNLAELEKAILNRQFCENYWRARSDAARVYADQMTGRVQMVEKRWADLCIAAGTLARLPRDDQGFIQVPFQIIDDLNKVASS